MWKSAADADAADAAAEPTLTPASKCEDLLRLLYCKLYTSNTLTDTKTQTTTKPGTTKANTKTNSDSNMYMY